MNQGIDDEKLVALIESGLRNASGDWLSGTELSTERQKATLEYGMLSRGHLAPQGVSQIVSSDTVEVVEGYTAIISELLFNNNKIAKFKPVTNSPKDAHDARVAADLTNYTIFKLNPGWSILNTWIKSALLWKNSIVRWDFIEDHEYVFEEYEKIDQYSLDELLSDDDVTPVGTLEYTPEVQTTPDGTDTYINMYSDVRLRRKVNKSRVAICNVPPENFRISKDAGADIESASFVGIETELSISDLRKMYPEKDIDWEELGEIHSGARFMSQEQATRKILAGVEAYLTEKNQGIDTEANRLIPTIECWIRVDRDGDGISELKHVFLAGATIVEEEDVSCIPIASLCPFEIPHEFIGLSAADMVRPSTLATTAILRGFVENVYLTNYSPKLADPNVVDFSALQNMKPKQVVATNGNPNGAVAPMSPDTISQGTVPLIEFLQNHKEQATGLSKAAQGLNDVLYVSGNSEQKVSQVQTAAQVRIQYMARRFVETGIKRFVEGVYKLLREKLKGKAIEYYDAKDYLNKVDPNTLPSNMLLDVDADVGDHGNTATVKKMQIIGKEIIPALQEAGAGAAVSPKAAINIAAQTIKALDLDPLDYLEDYTAPDFEEKVKKSRENEMQAAEKAKQLDEQIKRLDILQREGTIALTNIQSKNALQDNARQMAIAMNEHYKDWAKIYIEAAKEGIPPPKQPDIKEIWRMALSFVSQDASAPLGTPEVTVDKEAPAAATNIGEQPQ